MDHGNDKACPNPSCADRGKTDQGNVIEFGTFDAQSEPRKRQLCKSCGATFSVNTGTAYFGLRCRRDEFDQVASMRVEGVSISAIARIMGRSRSAISRWLQRAAAAAKRFNDQKLNRFGIKEMQADELCTFVGGKANTTWLFTIIEVSTRLWTSSTVGRRSYRNTEATFNDVIFRGRLVWPILVTSDGFDFYETVVRKLLGVAAVYGQVIKTPRNNRVIRVERALKMGSKTQLAVALLESEDSETLNTSFMERMNLTIRQGSAYLARRSLCHARCAHRLREHVELLKFFYNFVRPHRGLKFGPVCKTPAMQAGLADHKLRFRDTFGYSVVSRPRAAVLRFPMRRDLSNLVAVEGPLAA